MLIQRVRLLALSFVLGPFVAAACGGSSANPPGDTGGDGGPSSSSSSSSGGSSSSSGSSSGGSSSGSSSGTHGGSSSGSSSGAHGGSSSGVTADDGGGIFDGGNVTDGGSLEPPPSSDGGTATSARHNFAMHHIHLGDEIDPTTGNVDWSSYGYDLDHKDTAATSTGVCTLAANSPLSNQADGPNGVDNSFGKNIVPLLAAVLANPSQSADTALAAGKTTLLLDITGLDESNATQTATGLAGQVFTGAPFGQGPNGSAAVPAFTTADDWPLDRRSIASAVEDAGVLGAPIVATSVFTNPYVAGGTFVSGTTAEVTVYVPFYGTFLALPIQHPVITFVSNGTNAKSGVVAGVILGQDLIASLTAVAGNIASSFCPLADGGTSAAFDQVVTAIQQAQDILHDGTNTAGTPCDAISIGIGFDADEIGLPQVWGASAATSDPCN